MSNLDTEITLISSSLLPSETLEEVVEDFGTRRLDITNEDSRRSLQIHVTDSYPARDAVKVELSGENFGRDEAIRWRTTVEDMLNNWDKEDE